MNLTKLKFPDLILDKQDKSTRYPDFHWEEINQSKERRANTFDCFYLTEDNNYNYYMSIEQPYTITRKYNYPSEHNGSYYITTSNESDFYAITSFLPNDIIMPTIDLVNSITPDRWLNIYCEIIKDHPEKINYLNQYSFYVFIDNNHKKQKPFSEYCAVCFPFIGLNFSKNGVLQYKEKGNWVNGSYYQRLENNTGNILLFRRGDYFNGFTKIQPIIKIK